MTDKYSIPDAYESRVTDSLRRAFTNMRAYLLDQLDELQWSNGMLEHSAFNVAQIESVIDSLRDEAEKLGFGDAVDAELDSMKGIIDMIRDEAQDTFDRFDGFTDATQAMTSSLLRKTSRAMWSVPDVVANDIEDILVGSTTGTLRMGTAVKAISGKLDIRQDQAVTLASSSLTNFHRQVRTTNGDEAGIKWWLYDGPKDQVNRHFCLALVGKRYTLEQLERLKGSFKRDEKLIPVATWLGGYNCRHHLVPLQGPAVSRYKIGPDV